MILKTISQSLTQVPNWFRIILPVGLHGGLLQIKRLRKISFRVRLSCYLEYINPGRGGEGDKMSNHVAGQSHLMTKRPQSTDTPESLTVKSYIGSRVEDPEMLP